MKRPPKKDITADVVTIVRTAMKDLIRLQQQIVNLEDPDLYPEVLPPLTLLMNKVIGAESIYDLHIAHAEYQDLGGIVGRRTLDRLR